MRRYIVLLLITGIVWAQTDFDTLVLKDGTTYLGEYSKIEGEKVFFKTKDAFALQPVSLKQIERLELKDGQILYDGSNVKYSLALEDYQTLSTKEKGIYDASVVVLSNKEKNYFPKSILTNSEKEIYKQAYSKKLHQRKSKSVAVTCIVTVVIVAVLGSSSDFNMSSSGGDICFDPICD